ncbi:MAG: HD domain-containing protein [Dethiobacteria bacterium]|nr:HD domain-containing protein [Dethiobacteria bacterium]
MKRVNKIIDSSEYNLYLQNNEKAEEGRLFCKHHFEHLLEVARLTYILLLEDNALFISREMAYAAGLLHDIGRWRQYETDEDHAEASAKLAAPLLESAGFSKSETNLILKAVRQHRLKADSGEHRSPLSMALCRADAYARICFRCSVRDECDTLDSHPHRDYLEY